MLKNKIVILVTVLIVAALFIAAYSLNPLNQKIQQIAVDFVQSPKAGMLILTPPPKYKQQNVDFTHATISNDSTGSNNLLTLYVYFRSNYNDTLCAKILNKQGEAKMQQSLTLNGKHHQLQLMRFHFNQSITDTDNLILQ